MFREDFSGLAGRGSAPGRGGRRDNSDRQAVLDKARREREARALARLRTRAATHIQARFRGWASARRVSLALLRDQRSKVEDIVRLRSVLAAQGVPFQLPAARLSVMLQTLSFALLTLPDETVLAEHGYATFGTLIDMLHRGCTAGAAAQSFHALVVAPSPPPAAQTWVGAVRRAATVD